MGKVALLSAGMMESALRVPPPDGGHTVTCIGIRLDGHLCETPVDLPLASFFRGGRPGGRP